MQKVKKPRVVKDYDNLPEEIVNQLKLEYPLGFSNHLIKYKDHKGNTVSALPFEAEDKYYLVRMSVAEAIDLIEKDEDYDEAGILREDSKEELLEKLDDEEE